MESEEEVLGVLRRKWACRGMRELERGPRRFGRLARSIPGLRRPVLAAELPRLVGEGLVRRDEISAKPRNVSYALTHRGRSLCRLLILLREWETRNPSPGRGETVATGHSEMTT